MNAFPLLDFAGLDPHERTTLHDTLGSLRTLADVLDWSRRQSPPWPIVEILTQDEYTHDVVLHAAGQLYLAFDTT